MATDQLMATALERPSERVGDLQWYFGRQATNPLEVLQRAAVHIDQSIEKYVGNEYIQHNPGLASGAARFRAAAFRRSGVGRDQFRRASWNWNWTWTWTWPAEMRPQ